MDAWTLVRFVVSATTRLISMGLLLSSLVIVWLGLELTHG